MKHRISSYHRSRAPVAANVIRRIEDMAKFEIDFLGDYSDDAIAEELKRIAKKLGKATVSKNDIETYGKPA